MADLFEREVVLHNAQLILEGHGLELTSGYALGPELLLRDAEQAVSWNRLSRQPAGA